MPRSATFPAFIKAELDPAGSGFAEFQRGFENTMTNASRRAKAVATEISSNFSSALVSGFAAGKIDFGADQLRASAQAAQAQAALFRTVATNAAEAGEATSSYAKFTANAAVQAERHAAKLNEQATLMDRLQREIREAAAANDLYANTMDQSAAATGRAAVAHRAYSASAQRMAGIQLGQQAQDFAVQIASGQSALVAFTQQMSQAAFVAQGMGGTMGRLGQFLSGPWGTALFVGATAVGILTGMLGKNADAAEAAKTGADALGTAQSALSGIFDLTSGKLERQNELLVLNARLTAINLRADAAMKRTSSATTLAGARENTALGTAAAFFSRTGENPFTRAGRGPQAGQTLRDLNAGRITNEDALKAIGNLPDSAFKGTGASRAQVLQAIVDRAVVPLNEQMADAIDKSLTSGKLDPKLRKPDKSKPSTGAENAAFRLKEFGEDSADKIAQMREQILGLPGDLRQANNAARTLDDLISDLEHRKPAGFQGMVADARELQTLIPESLGRPFREMLRDQERGYQIQALTIAGRETEADQLALQYSLMNKVGAENEAQLATELARRGVRGDEYNQLVANLGLMREQARQAEILRQHQQRYLEVVSSTRENVAATFAAFRNDGVKAVGDFGKRFQQTMDRFFGEQLTEKLFGKSFRALEDKITGRDRDAKDKVADAATRAAGQLDTATSSVRNFGDAIDEAAKRLTAANDNPLGAGSSKGIAAGSLAAVTSARSVAERIKEYAVDGPPIVVTGRREPAGIFGASGTKETFGSAFLKAQEQYIDRLKSGLSEVFKGIFGKNGPFTAELGDKLGKIYGAASTGMMAGSIFGGGTETRVGSALGGVVGDKVGEKLASSAFGKSLGEVGKFLGPLAGIAGGLLGGALGSLLSKPKTGSATIGVGANGELIVTGLSGNSGKLRKAANENAGGALTSIERIAESLGATINASKGSVSIGFRNDNARVDPSGTGQTKIKRGAIDFGSDVEAAVKFATLDLIKDGVLEGLKAGTQRLLQNAKDLEAGLDKALRFEGVFRDLKGYKDPVGAALDDLDRTFKSLDKIFKEAGASTADYVALEELYGIRRKEAIEQATSGAVSSMKDLLRGLTVDNASLSLSSRRAAAFAEYDPLRTRVAAGDTTAFDSYAQAAQTLLDIQRQISGSGTDYFALMNEVTNLTKTAIAGVENATSIASARGSIFDPANRSSVTLDQTPVTSAIDRQTDEIVGRLGALIGAANAQNINLGAIITELRTGTGGGGSLLSGPSYNF